MIPSSNSDSTQIQDLGSLHHYRTEIPNIIYHLKLDPWAFKAYSVFKMTAGDKGSCFKSNSRLSEEIGCSIPTLIKLKKELVDQGLIKIQKRKHANGGDMPDLIQIVDIWPQNMEYMTKIYPKNPDNDLWPWKKNPIGGGKSDLVRGVNCINEGGKPGLDKQEHKEQKQKEEQQQSQTDLRSDNICNVSKDAAASFEKNQLSGNSGQVKPYEKIVQSKPAQKSIHPKIHEGLKPIDIPINDKIEISTRYPADVVKNAIEWATQPDRPINKCLAAAIKFACKNGLKAETKKQKLSIYEEMCIYFKNGQKYNGAECFFNSEGIAFQRGMKHEQITLDKYFSWEKFYKICANFGLNFKRNVSYA